MKYAKTMKDLDDAQVTNELIQASMELTSDKKLRSAERAYYLVKERVQTEELLRNHILNFNEETFKFSQEFVNFLALQMTKQPWLEWNHSPVPKTRGGTPANPARRPDEDNGLRCLFRAQSSVRH
jgi:hypothetical protein